MATAEQVTQMIQARVQPMEAVVQGLQTTVTAQDEAMRGLRDTVAAQQVGLEAMREGNRNLQTQLERVMTSHELMHKSLQEVTTNTAAAIAAAQAAAEKTTEDKKQRCLDPKLLCPEPLGDTYAQEWRAWSRKAKRFMRRMERGKENLLGPLLDTLEYQTNAVTAEDCRADPPGQTPP